MSRITYGPGPSPHLRRWMLFVDGENFAIQGSNYLTGQGMSPELGDHYKPGVFLWGKSDPTSRDVLSESGCFSLLQDSAMRAYYFTAMTGDIDSIQDVRRSLRALGFKPEVFKKVKSKSKGVDVTLTKEMLVNAYNNNYDAAVLIAGDGDYLPLVEEVQRTGKSVYVGFFGEEYGLSDNLTIEADKYWDFGITLKRHWERLLNKE